MHNYLIITGGSKGIGKQTAKTFADKGWKVINLSRHACEIESVTNIKLDLSETNWIKRKLELQQVVADPARIVLVHNAAVFQSDTIQTLADDKLRNILEVNVVAPVLLNQVFLPLMSTGSAIIYIGSTLSEKAVNNTASYATSKHALAGLMKATCQDLVKSGIHTCCVCPGFTDTEMLREHVGNDPDIIESIGKTTSFGRLVKPEEIAELIWFCSQNPTINGSVLHAHLGQIES